MLRNLSFEQNWESWFYYIGLFESLYSAIAQFAEKIFLTKKLSFLVLYNLINEKSAIPQEF